MSLRNSLQSLYFKISGFEQNEIDDIIYRTKSAKEVAKARKARKRAEKKILNCSRRAKREMKRCGITKSEKITKQIDRGFEVARRLMQDEQT